MTDQQHDEFQLLGLAVYLAQKIEFAFYGVASVASHLPEAQADKRLRGLTGEQFLRGDPEKLKVTLGQLVTLLGERLLLASSDMDRFVSDRNRVVHNYFRHYGGGRQTDGVSGTAFLADFLQRGQEFLSIVEGLIVLLKIAAAEKTGRSGELNITTRDHENRVAYVDYVARNRGVKAPS